MTATARAFVDVFEGEAAVRLAAGDLEATFLPSLGMLGASLRLEGEEFLSLAGGPGAFADGHTTALPLLAPWANRLAHHRYRAGRVEVDLGRLGVHTDDEGRPIHGTMLGPRRWRVERLTTGDRRATVRAGFDYDTPELLAAFPFPHRLTLEATVAEDVLVVTTTLTATGRRRVPVSFGFHPYFRLPRGERDEWQVELPRCRHLLLDDGIPTGESEPQPPTTVALAGSAFDDHYSLGRNSSFALSMPDGPRLEVRFGRNYRFAQVFAPPDAEHVALEPMTAATNALVTGDHPSVVPGERFRARFAITPSTR